MKRIGRRLALRVYDSAEVLFATEPREIKRLKRKEPKV